MAYRKKTPEEKLAELHEQERQLKNRIKSEKAAAARQRRKDDDRRKIIAGALALNHADKNPDSDFGHTMQRLIQEYVTDEKSRALFGLDPLPDTNQTTPEYPPPPSYQSE